MKKIKKLQREAVRDSGAQQRVTDFDDAQLRLVAGGAVCIVYDSDLNANVKHVAYPIAV